MRGVHVLSRNRDGIRPATDRGGSARPGRNPLPGLLAFSLVVVFFASESAHSQRGAVPPTPTPVLSSADAKQQQVEQIYEGYARLFVLGHFLSRAVGVSGVMPNTVDLSLFVRPPFLSESGDVYLYRSGVRHDVMWPQLVPTPQLEPVVEFPTETPTPAESETPDEMATPTPTPTPTPTEVIPPPLTLQIVSQAQTGPVAMIANELLSIGDFIEGATITEIGKHYVEIMYYGFPFIVTRDGTVHPDDFREEDFLFN